MGLIGTYMAGIFPTLQRFIQTGELAWVPRASFIGTLAGGALAVILLSYRDSISLGWRLDRGGLPWPLLLAIGRIGCLGVGCCGGRPTDSALALWLPDEAGRWAMRYPTQIMSGIANLFIFGILLAVERSGQKRAGNERTWPFNGFLFCLYVGLFCLERFSMEWLRADTIPLWGPLAGLTWSHWVAWEWLWQSRFAACGRHDAQKHRHARRTACPVFCHGERRRKPGPGGAGFFPREAWAAMARW